MRISSLEAGIVHR